MYETSGRRTFSALFAFALALGIVIAQPAIPGRGEVLAQGGDSPLTTLEAFTGNIDVVVKAIPHGAVSNPSGTFVVSGITSGATILRAYLITTSFPTTSTESATVTFNGQSLGTKPPDVSDPGGGRFNNEYHFDVTTLVTGDGSYPYSVVGTNTAYGDVLVVVYQHASLPSRRIVINTGAESLSQASSATSFAGFDSGTGRLIVFTEADNTSDSNEAIFFNGASVLAGDIFIANLGPVASLIDISVTVITGTNALTVTTGNDWFGLNLAVLVGPGTAAVPVPALASWALVALAGAMALIAWQRRRTAWLRRAG